MIAGIRFLYPGASRASGASTRTCSTTAFASQPRQVVGDPEPSAFAVKSLFLKVDLTAATEEMAVTSFLKPA